MPSQPSSTDTDAVRLAQVFVRLPKEHQQENIKPSAPNGPKIDSSDTTSPSSQQQHRPSLPKKEEDKDTEPTTPQKPTKPFFNPHHLPPTPDSTPTKSLKRSPPTTLPDPQTPSLKRHRTTTAHPTPPRSPHRRLLCASSSTPKFSIVYQPEAVQEGKEDAVSWMELKRVAESVMRQVDVSYLFLYIILLFIVVWGPATFFAS